MSVTIEDLMAMCINKRHDFTITASGSLWLGGQPVSLIFLKGFATEAATPRAHGYESLAEVFGRAFDQAASGKGKERHAQGLPFDQQPMQELCGLYGVGFALGQAAKKAQESQRLPHDRAVAELLGAINYLAGAVVFLERQAASEQRAHANDNTPCCAGGKQTGARCHGCAEAGGLKAEASSKK